MSCCVVINRSFFQINPHSQNVLTNPVHPGAAGYGKPPLPENKTDVNRNGWHIILGLLWCVSVNILRTTIT